MKGAYANNNAGETPFPHVLKGVDAAVRESLKALCVDVQVSPIVAMDDEVRESLNEYCADEDELPEWIIGKRFGVKVGHYGEIDGASEMGELYNRWGSYSDLPIVWLTPKHKELQIVYTAVSFVNAVHIAPALTLRASMATKPLRTPYTHAALSWQLCRQRMGVRRLNEEVPGRHWGGVLSIILPCLFQLEREKNSMCVWR